MSQHGLCCSLSGVSYSKENYFFWTVILSGGLSPFPFDSLFLHLLTPCYILRKSKHWPHKEPCILWDSSSFLHAAFLSLKYLLTNGQLSPSLSSDYILYKKTIYYHNFRNPRIFSLNKLKDKSMSTWEKEKKYSFWAYSHHVKTFYWSTW